MRAVAQDREAAALMGVNVDRIIAITFFIGAALAGAAGFIYGLQYGSSIFYIGFQLGLIAFTAAVLGGIGNIVGAMLGGVLIGIIEVTIFSHTQFRIATWRRCLAKCHHFCHSYLNPGFPAIWPAW